jgi:hypothetical protein
MRSPLFTATPEDGFLDRFQTPTRPGISNRRADAVAVATAKRTNECRREVEPRVKNLGHAHIN